MDPARLLPVMNVISQSINTTDISSDSGEFCNDPLWDTDLLISSSWPQFTSCFKNTVLTYVPFACLWLPLPFYLCGLPYNIGRPLPYTYLGISKMFLAAALALFSLVLILDDASGTATVSPAQYLANSIRAFSFAFVVLLTSIERKRRVTSSGLLFMTWTILVLCDIVPLYSRVMLKTENTSLVGFSVFILMFVMEVISLVLSCLTDGGEEAQPKKGDSPEMTASFPSQIFYWWMTRTVYQGWRRDLTEGDLFSLNPRDTSDALVPAFENKWKREVHRFKRNRQGKASHDHYRMANLSVSTDEKLKLLPKENGHKAKGDGYQAIGTHRKGSEQVPKPSLLRVLTLLTGPRLLVGLAQKLVSDIFLFLNPVLLSLLITYADNADHDYAWKGYCLAVLMFITQMFKSVLFGCSFWSSQIVGMQLKTTLIAAIYKKSLTMNNEARKESTAGEIVNLMSVDCQRVMDVMNFFFFAWTTPFQIIMAIVILYQYIGLSVFAGLAVLLLTVPFNSYIATVQQSLQRQNLIYKDARLRLTNEALSGMKVLKLYAWEPTFQEKISEIRLQETKILMKIAYCNTLVTVVFNIAPFLVMIATFAVYVNISDDNILDANKAFVALSFFNLLRVPLALLSTIISMTVQAKVSLERINAFLCCGDISPNNISKDSRAPFAIELDNATFTWDKETSPTLQNITLQVPENKLYAVVGPVGCGKSSLMSAMLGEMEKLSGRACIKNKVAYVPQQAWIQNATVRDNILFGKPYNERRYKKVIQACALERDLEILSAGDLTEIGEKGINLSGGQKQRVSLARAVYNDADIYILDDPLSAVDSHVGKHIFTNVIGQKGLLKNKTRILVTHGAHWLPLVDNVVVMEDGRIREQGSYEALMSHNGPFAEFIRTYLLQKDDDEVDEDPEIKAIKTQILTDIESATSDVATSGDELGGERRDKLRRQSVRSARSDKNEGTSQTRDTAFSEDDSNGFWPDMNKLSLSACASHSLLDLSSLFAQRAFQSGLLTFNEPMKRLRNGRKGRNIFNLPNMTESESDTILNTVKKQPQENKHEFLKGIYLTEAYTEGATQIQRHQPITSSSSLFHIPPEKFQSISNTSVHIVEIYNEGHDQDEDIDVFESSHDETSKSLETLTQHRVCETLEKVDTDDQRPHGAFSGTSKSPSSPRAESMEEGNDTESNTTTTSHNADISEICGTTPDTSVEDETKEKNASPECNKKILRLNASTSSSSITSSYQTCTDSMASSYRTTIEQSLMKSSDIDEETKLKYSSPNVSQNDSLKQDSYTSFSNIIAYRTPSPLARFTEKVRTDDSNDSQDFEEKVKMASEALFQQLNPELLQREENLKIHEPTEKNGKSILTDHTTPDRESQETMDPATLKVSPKANSEPSTVKPKGRLLNQLLPNPISSSIASLLFRRTPTVHRRKTTSTSSSKTCTTLTASPPMSSSSYSPASSSSTTPGEGREAMSRSSIQSLTSNLSTCRETRCSSSSDSSWRLLLAHHFSNAVLESPLRAMSVTIDSSIVSQLHCSMLYDEDEQKDQRGLGKLTQMEKVETGKVKLKVFGIYIKAAGIISISLSMLFFVAFQAASVYGNFWITDWTEDKYLLNASNVETEKYQEKKDYYLGFFGLFGIIQIIFLTSHSVVYWLRMVVAAKRLHLGMLKSIFRSPMSFFDTTPLGRIMNRFSRDIEVLDNNLPIIIRDYVSTFVMNIMTILVISITTPLFLTLVIPILVLYYFIQNFYIPTSRQLKRIESVTRSPIYSHFSETISGGPTIRAYDVVPRFIKESINRVDRNQSFYYISVGANRWLGMNLEILANIVILGSAIFAVVTPGLGGGAVGLSISYASQISGQLVWMVRQMSDMETNIVSVERLKEYSELESEADWVVPHRRPVPEWPQEGHVRFQDYRTRYREGLDLVLKGITCDFKAGEKVGIVGRTGAGKSSLALALFRLIEASDGSITVDGVKIADIGLHDVRDRLTILPQDPVLFYGTLRMNLDPLGQYSDNQLWQALTSAHLRDFVEAQPERLEHQVGEEGQSLSVGQRQLVCLARALLKKTKILILDEATAAVDMETDQLIQNTIRSEFKDCTIITIAHRLNTIMDYDRIMVLDAGLIKEMDSPANLLANPESQFYSMAREANLV